MSMESRSSYGFYGTTGGATGEKHPKARRTYCMHRYLLTTDEPEWKIPRVKLTAMDLEHAKKQAKKYCKDNGCKIVKLEETIW